MPQRIAGSQIRGALEVAQGGQADRILGRGRGHIERKDLTIDNETRRQDLARPFHVLGKRRCEQPEKRPWTGGTQNRVALEHPVDGHRSRTASRRSGP